MFGARLVRWWDDLRDGLGARVRAGRRRRPRPAPGRPGGGRRSRPATRDLKRLDLERLLEPDWFQHPRMLGYAAYADRFAGDLRGVAEHVAYLEELGVTYLHLMPLLQPRPAPTTVATPSSTTGPCAPTSAPIDDLRDLATTLRRHGISLCLDLVLNHVAREHEWAVAARARRRAYRAVLPHLPRPHRARRLRAARCPRSSPTSRPATSRGTTTSTAGCGRRSTRGSGTSTGRTPTSSASYADIILFLANLGVEVLRLDAIAFIWKRLGTTCQNQPEVHAITQALRAVDPHRRARPWSSRPRRSSRRPTSCTTSAAGATTARSATSPTTTA